MMMSSVTTVHVRPAVGQTGCPESGSQLWVSPRREGIKVLGGLGPAQPSSSPDRAFRSLM